MESKIKKIKEMYEMQGDNDYTVFSKNEDVLVWTKLLASIAFVVMDDKTLTSKDMIEIGTHFMAMGKALKSSIEMADIIEQVAECLKAKDEETNESSGEA